MIRGRVYHIKVSTINGHKTILVEDRDDIMLKKSFEWTFVTNKIQENDKNIYKHAMCFNGFKYSMVPKHSDGVNCQTFVTEILKFTTKWSNSKVRKKVKRRLGTLFL